MNSFSVSNGLYSGQFSPSIFFILTVKENTEVFSFCDEFDKNDSNLVLKYIV